MKSYTIIETELHQKLNWDMNLIVNCLEVVRRNFRSITNDLIEIESEIIAVSSFAGGKYPAIGISKFKMANKSLKFDLFELEEIIKVWIEKKGISQLIKESKNHPEILWGNILKD